MGIKILKRCYDNSSYIMYITYKKNDKDPEKYFMIKRKIRNCWVTVSDTGRN